MSAADDARREDELIAAYVGQGFGPHRFVPDRGSPLTAPVADAPGPPERTSGQDGDADDLAAQAYLDSHFSSRSAAA
jgi:hypothetical protein